MLGRFLCIAAVAALVAPAQSVRPEDLGGGKLLVASKDLKDPNFAKTVVLLVRYDEEGVVGLVINHRSTVPLSSLFEDLKDQTDPVYVGGPVETKSVLALLRSRVKPADAERVLADVSLIASEDLLQKTLSSGGEPENVRVYLGYAGWTVRQLENEVDQGAWFIFPGAAGLVFDSNPDSLWSRLIRRTEERIAGGAAPCAAQNTCPTKPTAE
jgi:putative transcriptional regulator